MKKPTHITANAKTFLPSESSAGAAGGDAVAGRAPDARVKVVVILVGSHS
jgi:hypothetical protein